MKLGISHQRPQDLNEDHFAYLRKMGVETMEVRLPTSDATFDTLREIRDKVADSGFELHEIMLDDLYSSKDFTLGLPGRDATIDRFNEFLTDIGRLGIQYTTYAWHTGGAYMSGMTTTRGVRTRELVASEALALPDAYDTQYDDDTMWANFDYFMERVLPVAREAGVKLQLHPNDPPLTHQGVARIFRSTDAYRDAIERTGGDNHAGILFCVGTWSEMPGPTGEGEDIVAAIREFGPTGHIHQVHLRNTSGPLPQFHETFPDNGYLDLPAIVRALAEVGFDGIVVPDHVPGRGRGQVEEAFIFGYIRALIQACS